MVQKQKYLMKHLFNHNELSFRFLRRKLEDIEKELESGQNGLKNTSGCGWEEIEGLVARDRKLREQTDELIE